MFLEVGLVQTQVVDGLSNSLLVNPFSTSKLEQVCLWGECDTLEVFKRTFLVCKWRAGQGDLILKQVFRIC